MDAATASEIAERLMQKACETGAFTTRLPGGSYIALRVTPTSGAAVSDATLYDVSMGPNSTAKTTNVRSEWEEAVRAFVLEDSRLKDSGSLP
jgi:hypothetical protein